MHETPAQWNKRLAPYARPVVSSSMLQLATTLGLFLALIVAAHALHAVSWLLGLPFSAMAGLLMVRVFIIQHDCGHRSFLPSRTACDWIGRSLSFLTLTPFDYWRRDHDKHHATSGNLDKRGFGDVDTLTVAEYAALGRRQRLLYRAYRNPFVMFCVGPAWVFLLRYRLPLWLGDKARGSSMASILLLDLALVVFFGALVALLGWWAVTTVWLPAYLVAATVGVWLFFVQHQHEDTYWRLASEWSFVEAALLGCSFYRLPGWLHWLTGYIGYHHVHHLSSRIPNYRLPSAYREIPELQGAPSVGIWESIKGVRLSLWCDTRQQLVSFRTAFTPAASPCS